MNERPTPETERVKGALHTNWDDLLNHARRLECERDEAREALAEEIKFHNRTHSELVQTQCQMQDVIRERDEAREALEAVNALEEMHAKPGSMEIAIKQNPAQAQWVAKCFASMVAASPNYTEMKFDLVAEGEKLEWLTVLIQKGNGKTPHQLRQEAEKERDEAREALEYIAHAGLSAQHIEDYAKEFLRRKEDEK